MENKSIKKSEKTTEPQKENKEKVTKSALVKGRYARRINFSLIVSVSPATLSEVYPEFSLVVSSAPGVRFSIRSEPTL